MDVLSDLRKGGVSAFETGGGGGTGLGYVDLTDDNPGVPASDTVRLFRKQIGGRQMAAQIGPSGLDTSLQPHVGGNAVCAWFPAGNGGGIETRRAAALTATGTSTGANVATTNLHSRMKRQEFLQSTASTSSVAGFRGAAQQFSVGDTVYGGFHYRCRWGIAIGTSVASRRAFMGLIGSTAAPTDVNPSTQTNIIGAGWDSGDANVQIMFNDGSGTAAKVDTGIPKPSTDRTSVFELNIFSAPAPSPFVIVELRDLVSGASFSTAAISDIPSPTTLLAPRAYSSVGGTSGVTGIALMGLYIETDY